MKRIIISVMAFLSFSVAAAADFDGSKPLLCSTVSVNECSPDGTCESVTAREVNAPDFLRVDVRKKTVAGTAGGTDRPANPIDSAKVMGGMLMVQGKAANPEAEGADDGLAWSMAIDSESGYMVLTASGHAAAFVIFGSCIAQ